MKFIVLALLVCTLMFALVAAVPADETITGQLYGSDNVNPQDPNSIFKLKKIKKLLFG